MGAQTKRLSKVRGLAIYNCRCQNKIETVIPSNLNDLKHYVADSAFYTGHNLQTLGQHTFWISHPPATIDEVKTLLVANVPMVPGKEEGYSFHERMVNYAGIEQKWVLIHSEKRRSAIEKKYAKNLDKRLEKVRKSLKKLRAKEFACEPDAQMAARLWFDDYPYLSTENIRILSRSKKKNGKQGRPRNNDSVETVYSVDSPIEIIPEAIEQEKARLGRFVLATNDLDLDADLILKFYKGQQSVERGFRFLKDKSFRVAEVFLKKESRIEALSMIMVLCLFVYAIAEWYLRSRLKETGMMVKNQLKKPIQNPTMKWIFTLFMRPAEITVTLNSHIQRFIVNLDEDVSQILGIMGPSFEKYYFARATCEM